MKFEDDIVAHMACGMQVNTDWTLYIFGEKGQIKVDTPWLPNRDEHRIVVQRDGEEQPEIITNQDPRSVYAIQVQTVADNLSSRQAPPPCMTWDDTLGNMRTLDRWRESVGLSFEGESGLTDTP